MHYNKAHDYLLFLVSFEWEQVDNIWSNSIAWWC